MRLQSAAHTHHTLTRRNFFARLGAGTAAIWASGHNPFAAGFVQGPDTSLPGQFGRMFRLPPFLPATDAIREALVELGKPGGIMDADDNIKAGPVALIVDDALNNVNRNSTTHTAGLTFFGQFLDHDITFDSTSRLGFPSQPIRSPNTRTPFFDLDSVYGSGPEGSPELYDAADKTKFKVQSGGLFEDLPRNAINSAAILGDRRNDENLILSGLHTAFLLLHNRLVDRLRSQSASVSDAEAFRQARRLTTWHYQWLIVHEFLPAIVGQLVIDDVFANGRRYYKPKDGDAFIPVEFQIVYRFGHSMVRPSYRANLAGDSGQPFFAMIFDPAGEGSADPIDLRGGARAPRRFVGWQTFFDFGGSFTTFVRPNKKIDTTISTPLFHLPLGAIAAGAPPTSLMQRNLLRHLTWQLPSGQDVAQAMNIAPLPGSSFDDLRGLSASLATSTPLLFYVLREADLKGDGERLGPVGARIIGEVFLGLLTLDPASYLTVDPAWVPTLPAAGGAPHSFRMTDLLTAAGVDPASRGQ
jgi:hypothetical protein